MAGSTFADTLARYPEVFGYIFIGLIKAGEEAGELEKTLGRIKDLLTKPSEAKLSGFFTSKGITKNELLSKMKNIGLIKSDERIDEIPVPVEEEKKTHPYGTKLVSKHYVKYSIPRERFEKKMKDLYKELFSECDRKHVFKDTEKLITDILDMDGDGAYRNRGGYDKDLVSEDGAAAGGGATSCGNVMQGGGGNPDAGQFITPVSPTQRKSFWKPAMKRNKDEKNGSISMNREK